MWRAYVKVVFPQCIEASNLSDLVTQDLRAWAKAIAGIKAGETPQELVINHRIKIHTTWHSFEEQLLIISAYWNQ